jgi:alkylated DNA repair dioxygenase AlkB
MTNLLSKDGEVYHIPNYYTPQQSKMFMGALKDKVKWQQDKIKMYGKDHNIPRLTSWYSLGGLSYTYSGINMSPNKIDFDELSLIHSGLIGMLNLIGINESLNSVLLNLYRDGKDSVSWHQDDESELGINPTIVSLTFGATRVFKLRHKESKLTIDVPLSEGSLLIMTGETQHHWEHSVPKTTKELGQRINLTFRTIK